MKELNRYTKTNPFKVPENYFSDVSREVMERTSIKPVPVYLYDRMRTFIAAAAVIAGLALLTLAAVKLLENKGAVLQFEEIIAADNTGLIINDIDLSSLEQSVSQLVIPETVTDASENEIIDYLLLENIDISEIYEHL